LTGSGTSSATESLVVANDGTITGSTADACIYNGKITIPDPAHNLFRMHLEIANCAQSATSMTRNGEYDGLGTFVTEVLRFDDSPPTELTMLNYSVIGPVWPGTRGLTR